jgi:archaetidylinositol phosphate synthase
MISRWIRTWYGKLFHPFLVFLARLGITANTLTVISLMAVTIAGILFAIDRTIAGAWILLLGGFLDGIDGELARVTHVKSPFGGFLDSVCDHCGDFALYLGLLWFSMKSNASVEIFLLFVALFASVFGSHVRSRAGMVGIDVKDIGIFTRCERIFILFFGILFRQMIIALWILALLNSFSAIQRVMYTIRVSQKRESHLQNQVSTAK